MKISALHFSYTLKLSLLLGAIFVFLTIPAFSSAQTNAFPVGDTAAEGAAAAQGAGVINTPSSVPLDPDLYDDAILEFGRQQEAAGNAQDATGAGQQENATAVTDPADGSRDTVEQGTQAFVNPDFAEGTLKYYVYYFFTSIGGMVAWIGGNILDFAIDQLVLGFGRLLTENFGVVVNNIWTIVRDFFNIIFIFALIWMGLRTILKSDDTEVKRNLGMLIVAALLINFSLFITKAIVDFSNLAAVQIAAAFQVTMPDTGSDYNLPGPDFLYNNLSGAQTSISVAFAESMKLSSFAGQLTADDNIGKVAAYSFMVMIVMIIAGFVFLAGGILMITRFVSLLLAMIFSPVMFLGWIYPGLKQHSDKWWRFFLSNAFVAPAYLFMLYIVLSLIGGGSRLSNGTFANAIGEGSKSLENGNFAVVLFFGVIIALLIAATRVAQFMGASGASAVMSVGGYGANKLYGGAKALGMMPVNYGKRVGQNAGGAVYRNTPLIGGKSYEKASERLKTARAKMAAGEKLSKGEKLAVGWGTIRGAGSLDDRAAQLKAGVDYKPLGGKSTSERKAADKSLAQENANQLRSINLNNAIEDGFNASPSSNAGLEFADQVTGASAQELSKVLAKIPANSPKYQAIVNTMTPNQFDEVQKLKDEDFNTDNKSTLANVRSAGVIKSNAGTGATNIGANIKDLSLDDLKVLDFQTQIIANAGNLQASQLDDLKKDPKFKGARFGTIKTAHEQALNGGGGAPSMSMTNIISSRKGEANVAKLPESTLSRTTGTGINEFAQELVRTANQPNTMLNNSLLTKIATRDDLDGAVKKQIGKEIIRLTGGPTGLTNPAFPSELKRFFENGPGVQMR